MLKALRQIFRGPAAEADAAPAAGRAGAPAVPAGTRVYAVGDIHGRLDLFAALAAAIDADDAAAAPAETTVVLLGDLVDRGPDSAGVLALARDWQQRRAVRILAGNHEEMMLQSFDSVEVMRHFLRHGGRETVLSFGVDEAAYDLATYEEVQAMMRAAIPPETIDFIAGFEDRIRFGDYAFVHAGVRPGQPLEDQTLSDLRWIREAFITSPADHGAVVVHGHTITEAVEVRPNRIGIDTGAYMSDVLSALCLEGSRRRLIEARAGEGGVTIHHRPLA
ncbi:MAG: serine/threonine protein phosphatase [Proteobacteria bacterium]|nr:serine/threonine protein phosphatase [Pseudomonadota bacterium]